MYNLYQIRHNHYEIHSSYSNEKAMEGTLLAILTYATYTLGFDINQLEIALLEMLERDMDGAHFGINRTFIYAFNRSERKVC